METENKTEYLEKIVELLYAGGDENKELAFTFAENIIQNNYFVHHNISKKINQINKAIPYYQNKLRGFLIWSFDSSEAYEEAKHLKRVQKLKDQIETYEKQKEALVEFLDKLLK